MINTLIQLHIFLGFGFKKNMTTFISIITINKIKNANIMLAIVIIVCCDAQTVIIPNKTKQKRNTTTVSMYLVNCILVSTKIITIYNYDCLEIHRTLCNWGV